MLITLGAAFGGRIAQFFSRHGRFGGLFVFDEILAHASSKSEIYFWCPLVPLKSRY
jgi:hypothetical protein